MRKRGETGVKLRNLVKEKLSKQEIEALAKLVGDPKELVAPKRRAEAEGLSGAKLIDWLAADGGHLRRPIVIIGKKVTLGFNGVAQAELEKLV